MSNFYFGGNVVQDTKYVAISGTTDNSGALSAEITTASTITSTYDIANFSGSGLITDNVRSIVVEGYAVAVTGTGGSPWTTTAEVRATMPDGSYQVINHAHDDATGNAYGSNNIILSYIPINSNTTQISIQLYIDGTPTSLANIARFRICGAIQLEK